MSDPNDDKADLDWLYRREQATPPPAHEPTQVMPAFMDEPRAGNQPPYQGAPQYKAPQYTPPPAAPPAAPTPRGRRPRRRRGFLLGRLILGLVLAYIVFMVATPVYHFGVASKIDAMPAGERPAEQPGKVVLLVGSDSRENLTPEQQAKYGTGTTEGARTDTILMLFIPETGKPALISLPRDSYVPIPGHGRNKLNAAYAFGGPKLLVQTVEQVTGVRVDEYLQVGMVGFAEMVDAVGGIEVCLDKPMKDKDSHADFPAGCQQFDGVDALAYVRMRKADPTGDIGRMARQREVIGKVADKALSPRTLWPPTWWQMNSVAGQLLVRDQGTSMLDVADAGRAFVTVSGGGGYQLMVPIANANATTSAGSSMLWDTEKALELFTIVKSGNSAGIEQFVK
ncbi:LCP family protein [Propionibacteriaceae bacterium G1746]|uniref:LCP family protein n=1 Tax=Aestuariimicrobium sp. G57 TaxID=3418485 RepID=UPI003C1CC9EF